MQVSSPVAPATSPVSAPSAASPVSGEVVRQPDGLWFRIRGVNRMAPFLMTLASDRDHWLFLLSNGGLTAGRGNPDRALFPYYTQDKLLDMADRAGSAMLLRVHRADGSVVTWEPFGREGDRDTRFRRDLAKNELGNHVVLEESHPDLGLAVRLSWRPSSRFGFVRRVELANEGDEPVRVEVLDGLVNLLPPFVGQRFQNEFSVLGDAYKQAEVAEPGNLAVVHLSSVPTDLAEPMEALLATVAWQVELPSPRVLLTERQVNAFRSGDRVEAEPIARGLRPAFLNVAELSLRPGAARAWITCADIEQDRRAVEELQLLLSGAQPVERLVEEDCRRTEQRLRAMLAGTDGFQCTRDARRTMRHTSNTLFNLMRGGAFITGYELPLRDLVATVAHFDREAARRVEAAFAGGPAPTCLDPWAPGAAERLGRDALRLVREYLPLTFSRRHGDPSRPWNRFNIDIQAADGSPRFAYQGNWRDIFQNWEALLQSWPEYAEASICRFLNATTADGYNPYRVTKDGFEWEVLEPHDTWANIGYWGDHQVNYLLRLLETSVRFHPGRLAALLDEQAFVYAEIPYRIRPYGRILENPRETIDYDHAWEARIKARVERVGNDGKLLHAPGGGPLYVSLLEKLLAPLLAKLSNFVPGGGIWMNTQRPEWNDANNALVGYGISVVTLGYVARYLRFLGRSFGAELRGGEFHLSRELATLLRDQIAVFAAEPGADAPAARKAVMDALGESASRFRASLYDNGLAGERVAVPGAEVLRFLERALVHAEATLRANRRPDALWHSYNLLRLGGEGIGVDTLFPMLEGQVSILSSELLGVDDTLALLEAMRASPLYRADQDSYLLYPDRDMPGFLGKNGIPRAKADAIPLLRDLLAAGDTRVVAALPSGKVAFNGRFHNAKGLRRALASVPGADAASTQAVVALFEETFNHRAFTGRSGTFFAYEGLGSIYWHMVSKLVLAVQESHARFRDTASPAQLARLAAWYRALREGLGTNKSPAHYGAIPTDAYSHTPAHAGAQQPGMTGQVKEDILIRLAELGISVEDGCLRFRPDLLEAREFLDEPATFAIPRVGGGVEQLAVAKGALAFSYCQVPFVVRSGAVKPSLTAFLADGSSRAFATLELPEDLSRELFRRTGKVVRVEVDLPVAG